MNDLDNKLLEIISLKQFKDLGYKDSQIEFILLFAKAAFFSGQLEGIYLTQQTGKNL